MFFYEKKMRCKILQKNRNLLEQKRKDFKSRLLLFFSALALFAAFVLIFFDNINLVTPENIIGDTENPTTWIIFFLGAGINFFCVPLLYWSSYEKFKKNDDFWSTEIFWILPLSFFGTFFQYLSDLPYILVIIPFSLILISVVHIWVMLLSKNLITTDEQFENNSEYFSSFTYLTAYYFVILITVIFFDLFEKIDYWI